MRPVLTAQELQQCAVCTEWLHVRWVVKSALVGLAPSSPRRCTFSHPDAITCFGVAVNAGLYCTYTRVLVGHQSCRN